MARESIFDDDGPMEMRYSNHRMLLKSSGPIWAGLMLVFAGFVILSDDFILLLFPIITLPIFIFETFFFPYQVETNDKGLTASFFFRRRLYIPWAQVIKARISGSRPPPRIVVIYGRGPLRRIYIAVALGDMLKENQGNLLFKIVRRGAKLEDKEFQRFTPVSYVRIPEHFSDG